MASKVCQGWFGALAGVARPVKCYDAQGYPFAPDWVILTNATKRPVIKTRTMGLLSREWNGGNVPVADAIVELTHDGFILGTNDLVDAASDTGSNGLVQWIAGKTDGIKSHCYSYVGEGGSTNLAKAANMGTGSVKNVHGNVPTFTPSAVIVVSENANHLYFKTADMPAGNSLALSTTSTLDVLLTALTANAGVTVASTLNGSGVVFHVLAFADEAGVFDTLTYTGTGGASTVAGATFEPDGILQRGNVAQYPVLWYSSYAAGDPTQQSKLANASAWHTTGFINTPTATGWNVAALAGVQDAVAHYAMYWKANDSLIRTPRLIGLGRQHSRPYTADSWWNTPIHAAAASDAGTAGYIKNLKACVDSAASGSGRGASISGTDKDAAGSGQSHAWGTKYHPLASWTWDSAPGYSDKGTFLVRTPPWLTPGAGNDATVSIYDEESNLWFNAFVTTKISETAYTYTYAITYPGNTPGHQTGPDRHNAVRNHGSELLAGAIRKSDMMAGVIRHKLAYIYGSVGTVNDADGERVDSAADGYKWGLAADGVSMATATDAQINPASTQSYTNNPNAIPCGSVLRLKASLTDNDLATLSVGNPRQLVIAKALRDYGMVFVDGVNGFYIAAERGYYGNFRWDGWLDWRDARDLTKSSVMNTTYWDVVQMPTAWQPAP